MIFKPSLEDEVDPTEYVQCGNCSKRTLRDTAIVERNQCPHCNMTGEEFLRKTLGRDPLPSEALKPGDVR